jgi:hypothetical protein
MTILKFVGRHRRLHLLLPVCFLAALVSLPVQATIMQYLEVEDLTRLSSDIFHGEVISTETYWNAEQTRIYTRVRVRIDESFKGITRRSEIITVTQLGGEKDGVKVDFSGRPEFRAGESIVLFTSRRKSNDYIVVGLKQGKMNVAGGKVKRDFTGLTLVDRSGGGKIRQSIRSDRMMFDELRNRIARTQ